MNDVRDTMLDEEESCVELNCGLRRDLMTWARHALKRRRDSALWLPLASKKDDGNQNLELHRDTRSPRTSVGRGAQSLAAVVR